MKLYLLELSDAAAPSFCTLLKPYAATEDVLERLLAQGERPKAHPLSLLHTAAWSAGPWAWTHWNIWDCPYPLRCDEVRAQLFWAEAPGGWFRFLHARFQGLRLADSGKPLGGMRWGEPLALVYAPPFLETQLLEPEACFRSRRELEEDHERFCLRPQVDFTQVCNDIFGDG